jgi:hypothetical protein
MTSWRPIGKRAEAVYDILAPIGKREVSSLWTGWSGRVGEAGSLCEIHINATKKKWFLSLLI